MGKLQDYFLNNSNGRLMTKWLHYFDIYERHFGHLVGKPVNMMEIGVYQGGSLQMWKHYFGKRANIYGVDILPQVKAFEEDRVHIHIGDQGDREFWRALRPNLPMLDVIIDDGGHLMMQQRVTFEEMYGMLSPNGIYLIEDLHTSYWPEYGGGYRNPDSFLEYTKIYIDKLNGWHSRDPGLGVDGFTTSAWSMSYYDSVLVIEKRPREMPQAREIGNRSF
jgi:hypothetical protein